MNPANETTTQTGDPVGGRAGRALGLALVLVGIAAPGCQQDDGLTQEEYDRRRQTMCEDVCPLVVTCTSFDGTHAECKDECLATYGPTDVSGVCAEELLVMEECLAAAEDCEDYEIRQDSENDPSGPCHEEFRRAEDCLNSHVDDA